MSQATQAQRHQSRTRLFIAALLIVSGGLAFLSLVLPNYLLAPALPLAAGQVARQDFQAPGNFEFVSEVLTEQARSEAERAIQPVYSPPDPSISRQQIEKLREALSVINATRANAELTTQEKYTALEKLADAELSTETVNTILLLSDARWATVAQESLSILEQIMRGAVREDQIETSRRSLSRLTSLELTDEQANLVAEIVSPFIIPNSYYSPELTDAARQAARENVQPVSRSYLAGEIIVARGRVLNEDNIEALTKMGLIQEQPKWQEFIGALALTTLMVSFLLLYYLRRGKILSLNKPSLLLITGMFLVALAGARFMLPGRILLPFMYPIPAFGMLLAVLFGLETALVFSIPLAIMAAYGLPNTLELTVYFLMTSLCSVLALGSARRVEVFVRAGVVVAGAGAAAIIAYRLPFADWDALGISQLVFAAIFNGAASASVALLLQYFFAQQFGLVTPLQLLELSRPDHPLLQFFLRNAPGTYQHSLQVSNLAEQGAEAIGADTLLVRVGALYHDCGKAANAEFFIENQLPQNINTHDDMDPLEAAKTIIQHVPDGVTMARKHRLPERIQDFMREHHGTLSTRYQYNRAVENANGDKSKVDINHFRYPGPRPQSRETALLMLADGVEARARAERPTDEDTLRTIVRRVIDHCQQDGQLDDTRLTLSDLHTVTEAFVTTLRGTYHVRVQYPKLEGISPDVPTQPQKMEQK